MDTPTSPSLRRSGHTILDPDSVNAVMPLQPKAPQPAAADGLGPVPPGNRPGADHQADETDRPDLDDFVERFSSPVDRAGQDTGSSRRRRLIVGAAAALLTAGVIAAARRR